MKDCRRSRLLGTMKRRQFLQSLSAFTAAPALAAEAPWKLNYMLASSMYGSLPLADILPEGNTFDPGLNFRYFQNLEGEFELPEGFVPEQVEVKAESTKPAANKVEKIFSWSVVEA